MAAPGPRASGPLPTPAAGRSARPMAGGCYRTLRPKQTPNAPSLSQWIEAVEIDRDKLALRYRHVNAAAPPFEREAERLGNG